MKRRRSGQREPRRHPSEAAHVRGRQTRRPGTARDGVSLSRTETSPATPDPSRSEIVLWGSVLVVATFLAYVPALRGGLVWDDDAHLTKPALRSLEGLWRIWVDPTATQQYYPLTHSVFWVQYRLWGEAPTGYHIVNVLLHALNAGLVWVTLRRLAVPGALLAGMIFALHPVHVESVAWISELKNTLSGTMYLSALLAFLVFDPPDAKAAESRDPMFRDWRWYGLALALFVCALLAKTVTASLPAAVLVIIWWKRGRIAWRRDVAPLIPFFILGVAMGLVTVWIERHYIGAEGGGFAFTPLERVLIAGRALWFYAAKLFWPVDLLFMYPRWEVRADVWWQYLFPLGAAALVAGLWTVRRRTGRAPIAAVLFFGGTLVPALGFFSVYPFRFTFVADHFQYLASLGIIAFFTGAVAVLLRPSRRLWDRWPRRALCTALLLTLAVLSWRQCGIYRDVETLWRDTIARNPGSWLAHNNLGVYLDRLGRTDEALREYRTAIAINPQYAESYNNLGAVYADQGKLAEAIEAFRTALTLFPRYADAQTNLGQAYLDLGRRRAGEGRYAEAIEAYRSAVAERPDLVEAHASLAAAYAQLGDQGRAVAAYRSALAIVPTFPKAIMGLAWIHATSPDPRFQDGPEALRLARLLVRGASSSSLEVLDTLAAAQARAGNPAEAAITARRAIELAKASGQLVAASVLSARLTYYERGFAYTAPSVAQPPGGGSR